MNRNRRPCCRPADHLWSRRLFLHGMAAGTAACGGFGRLFSAENAGKAAREQKHVVLLWMSGGASQFETWDPKPGRPTAGPHMTIPTAIPGVRFDEFLPGLARLADRMAVVRSLRTSTPGHVEGSMELQTGHLPSPATAEHPHFFSILSHEIPTTAAGLPNYVTLGHGGGPFPDPGPGFLGAKYGPLVCEGDGKGPGNLPVPNPALRAQVDRREALRAGLGERFAAGRRTALVETHEAAYRGVGALLDRHGMFDLSQEPAKDRARYGDCRFGRDCLLARRLVEHGVPFVKVQYAAGVWDKHDMLANGQRHLTTEFDRAASALIDDLIDRGLFEKTLVICLGEMGRTPNVNGNGGGRDHWNRCWSMSLGGCGIRGGVVVGATDENGTDVEDRLVDVHELFATFYAALGVDPHKALEFETRPIPFVERPDARPLPELF